MLTVRPPAGRAGAVLRVVGTALPVGLALGQFSALMAGLAVLAGWDGLLRWLAL